MTAASQAWTEELVELAGSKIQLVKGGSGEPLLILHDEMGHTGWLRWHQELAQNHTLYIPSHSGYGGHPPCGVDLGHAGPGRVVSGGLG